MLLVLCSYTSLVSQPLTRKRGNVLERWHKEVHPFTLHLSTAMGFRFQRRLKLFPGFHLNFSKSGVSASAGFPGFTVNSRGTTTASIPGTGISYRHNHRSTAQRRQAQRPTPSVPSTEATIQEVMATLSGPDCVGDALWRQGLAQKVIDHDDTPRRVREAALLIKSPEMVELHLRRARAGAATRKAAMDVIRAVQTVLAFTSEQGWSISID